MKGILCVDELKISDAKSVISRIHHELTQYCTIDEAVSRLVSLNAPIGKNDVFYYNELGVPFAFEHTQTESVIRSIKKEYISPTRFKNIEADNIIHLCLQAFNTMGFEAVSPNANDSISFKHPDEVKTPGGYFWFDSSPFTMHHGNSVKSVNIFDALSKLPQTKELLKKNIDYDGELKQFNTNTKIINVNEPYLICTEEIEQSISEFLTEDDGLFSIRSPMGTGKSTIIKSCINDAHNQDMKVLIITNRISVAEDFSKKYNIKLYNKDQYNYGDSLVCQFDSLWRFDIKTFDVVIMDEFISLMMHSRNTLNNSNINVAKFFAAFNKKLVIADAFLTGFENFLLDHKKTNIHMVNNHYRDETRLLDYSNCNKFVQTILDVAQREKVTVSGTSLSFIQSLQLLLENKGLKVVTLTATTPKSTKELVYNLFELDDHDKWDVLIYSPTLTVGVSNLNKIDNHFHYDGSMSTDVISSIQMMKRTRKAKNIHMFIRKRHNYLKTTYNDIRDDYMCNLNNNINGSLLFEIDDYGEPRLSKIGKKSIKIDTFKNILEFDHYNALVWMTKYHFSSDPVIIDSKFDGDVLRKYKMILRENKEALLDSNIDQFLRLNEIQKNDILTQSCSDKLMTIIAEINEDIKHCDNDIKTKIIELSIRDIRFLDKCKHFDVVDKFINKEYDSNDIKVLVNKSVSSGDNDDLRFFNSVLNRGQIKLNHVVSIRSVTNDKNLRNIVDKCGYNKQTNKNATMPGQRFYVIDDNVLKYHKFIKE